MVFFHPQVMDSHCPALYQTQKNRRPDFVAVLGDVKGLHRAHEAKCPDLGRVCSIALTGFLIKVGND